MTRASVLRSAWIVLIAALVAPLIGGVVFFLYQASASLLTGSLTDIGDLAAIIALGVYPVGEPIALLAGVLVGVFALWRTPTLGVILGAIVATNVANFVWQPIMKYSLGGFVINLAASVIAGAVCWWMFRRRLGDQR
jgi:hypothetical protein